MTSNAVTHQALGRKTQLALDNNFLTGLLPTAPINSSSSNSSDRFNDSVSQFRSPAKAAVAPLQNRRSPQNAENCAVSRLEKILQLLPAGVVVLDSRGHIAQCNELAESMLGEDLLGSSWRLVIDRAFTPRSDDGHEISLKDGRRISLSTRSLEDEPGQLILLTDLTETRKLQQQVSRNERLTAMGKMVSSLAHQIRTPLSAALLYSGNLQSATLQPGTVNRFASRIQSRLHNIERQIRDMLLFAKGEASLDTVVNTEKLFAQVESAVADMAGSGTIQFIFVNNAQGARLLCNEDALVGALLNLIENAMQAGNDKNCITLRAESNLDTLQLSVIDEGPGLSPELAGDATEEFVTTKPQGTGLGLAVAKMVAEAHKGRFFFQSKDGHGVEAGFALPLAQHPQAVTGQGV